MRPGLLGPSGHLGFAHGPHFCLGARWLGYRPRSRSRHCCAASSTWRWPCPQDVQRIPDSATWRLAALPVTL